MQHIMGFGLDYPGIDDDPDWGKQGSQLARVETYPCTWVHDGTLVRKLNIYISLHDTHHATTPHHIFPVHHIHLPPHHTTLHHTTGHMQIYAGHIYYILLCCAADFSMVFWSPHLG